MENAEIFRHVDHTLLKATASMGEIRNLCEEGMRYHTASVCIPSAFVAPAKREYPSLNICTVIGFPLGYTPTSVKLFEAQQALADGADEIDMVVNLGDVKDGAFGRVTAEIAALKEVVGTKVLKVIVECCYLTQAEKIALCRCVTDGGADYIKTSTGFGSSGATLEDIALFKRHIGSSVKMKAAGGIRTRADMEAFLNAGCERIGTSAAVSILAGDME